MPVGLGAIASAAGSVLSNGMGVLGTHLTNQANKDLAKGQQEWNEQQWLKQQDQANRNFNIQNRVDIMKWRAQNRYNESRWEAQNQHNLDMWNMQNAYNSPVEQMARLQKAGINPAMVYANGATHTASSVPTQTIANSTMGKAGLSTPDIKGYSRANAENLFRGVNVFGEYQRLRNLQAQTDNVEANTAVQGQEKLNKQQEALFKAAATLGQKQKNKLFRNTFSEQVEAYKLGVEQQRYDLEYTKKTQNDRIAQAKANVELAISTQTGKELENTLKRESIQLREAGVNESDSVIPYVIFLFS